MTSESIWVTGMSGICALGSTPSEIIDNLLAGRSGIRPVTRFPVQDHSCRIAAPLEQVPTPPEWDPADFAQRDLWDQVLLWTATQALRDAGLWAQRRELRIGLILGIGGEWIVTWEMDIQRGGERLFRPDADQRHLARDLNEQLGLQGPAITVGAACASANIALGVAKQWLRSGWVDVCLAGGCECAVTPMGMAGFGNVGALSKRNDDPQRASRPFDKSRDGFVMGEGGALFVLERAADARRRGAAAHGELAGFGASSDAHHLVIPSTDPEPASRAIAAALADARLAPSDVGYINAHATSTPIGDVFEARGLQLVFGESLGQIPVSSTKSMTGHLLSAASAIEALACLTALERQAIPPTINLDDLDPECANLCHVPHHAREQRFNAAISNAFGFGGANTCVAFRRVA